MIVIILVFAPAFMRAIFQRCFVTRTLHIVHPDRPGSFAVCVVDHVSQMSVQPTAYYAWIVLISRAVNLRLGYILYLSDSTTK